MPTFLPSALTLLALAAPPVETHFVQVAPFLRDVADGVRSPGQDRAVVLIHGLSLHLLDKDKVATPLLREWQKPESVLVKWLARDADVFAFAYAQTVAADEVAAAPDLGADVRLLRRLGYRSVVLVGYSAGGLIARRFVEDDAGAGVTKVIQVCTPNGGSSWARLQAVRSNQVTFLASLTKASRERALAERADKRIPPHVEFVCVVGTGSVHGDGLVACRRQWTEDLQRQGVPAYPLNITHWHALRSPRAAPLLADLVRLPQPRWDPAQVAAARRQILGR